MKVEKYLPKSSQEKITNAVSEAEKKINAEIVPVFMISSDDYTEAKLRGAILTSTLFALGILIYDHLMGWYQFFLLKNDWLFVASIGVAGILGYLSFGYIPVLKKLMISKQKLQQRSSAMAERVFGEYKLFETKGRTGVLIFVSLFEHSIEIVPDKGLKEKIADDEWHKAINDMKPALKARKFDEAFVQSIARITEILIRNKMERTPGSESNELPDHLRENI